MRVTLGTSLSPIRINGIIPKSHPDAELTSYSISLVSGPEKEWRFSGDNLYLIEGEMGMGIFLFKQGILDVI